MAKKIVSMELPEETVRALKAFAKEKGMTLSEAADRALSMSPIARRAAPRIDGGIAEGALRNGTTAAQCLTVLNFMEKKGSITSAQAAYMGIMRLSARIWDLRDMGYPIKTEMVRGRSKKVRYGRYSLIKEGEAEGGEG